MYELYECVCVKLQTPIHRKSIKFQFTLHIHLLLLNNLLFFLYNQFNCNMTDFVYQGEDFDEKVRKQVEFYFLIVIYKLINFMEDL